MTTVRVALRSGLRWRCLVVLATAAIFALAPLITRVAHAQGTTTKVVVDAQQGETVSDLEAAGGSVVARRGSYLVMSVPSGPASMLSPSPGLTVRDDFDEIQLSRETVSASAPVRRALGAPRRLKLVQFSAPPVDADLESLLASGARIIQYIPQNAYLVWTPGDSTAKTLNLRAAQSSSIQYYGDYLPSHSLARVLDGHTASAASIPVTVQLFDHEQVKGDIDAVLALADALLAEPTAVLRGRYVNLRVMVPGTALDAIAQLDSVVRVEPYVEPRLLGERQGQILASNLDAVRQAPSGPGYLSWLAARNFSINAADYPIVAVVDDGVDDGTVTPQTDEFYVGGLPSLASRLLFSVVPPGSSASGPEGPDGHGHINASIIGGYNDSSGSAFEDATGFNYGLGISPFGRLANVRVFSPSFDAGLGDATMVNDYYQRGARISANSWGANVAGSYTTDSQLYDSLSRDAQSSALGNQELLFIFANGNAGPGAGTVGSPATGKNVLAVGASETFNPDASNGDGCGKGIGDANDARDMAGFSSRGPCNDGRIKPEIVAPGTFIQGNASQPNFNGSGVCGAATNNFAAPGTDALFPAGSIYTWSSGTSHSTPGIAGYASLITEYLARVHGLASPSPALLKAYVVHSGRHLSGSGANESLPGNSQGFGIADMEAGFRTAAPRHLIDQSVVFGASGESTVLEGQIVDPSEEVRIALVWTDAPGPTFGNAYVNDLDLVVDIGGTTYRGNNFALGVSQPGGTADFRNNSEAVFLPAGQAGAASITVNATTIAGDGLPGNTDVTDQDYALVAYNFSTTISDGRVDFDSSTYSCADVVGVSVTDSDLANSGPFAVTVTTTGGDAETVTVSEATAGSGFFEGSIATTTGLAAAGDGVLGVANAETLTVSYLDADDGTGASATKQATALTDCVSPVLSNIASSNVAGSTATISFVTDEAAIGTVNYGTACGALSQSSVAAGAKTSHEIGLSGLLHSTQYFYAVVATDLLGNVATDDNGGTCHSFATPDRIGHFTELFSANDLDVAGQTLTFTPNGSSSMYAACRAPATVFPSDPSGATVLPLSDDDSALVSLVDGKQVSLYGTNYGSFHVGSNGYLTFGAADIAHAESLSAHFSLPRVSGLFDDLNPSAGGQISWKQTSDRVVVTYANLPEYSESTPNSFQIELFFDGVIRITHLSIDAVDGIVGLSAGLDVPAGFVESDLSGYSGCTARIDFDSNVYRCSDPIGLSVADGDLLGGAPFSVSVVTSGSDNESVTLSESPVGSGLFGGSIGTASGAVVVGDGVLDVSDGEVITATYEDASNGAGVAEVVQGTALTDCVGPGVSSILATSSSSSSANVSLLTSEPASVQVRYGTSCMSLGQIAAGSGLTTNHDVTLSGLSPSTQYFYVIDATDAVGNLTTDDDGGGCHSFVTVAPSNDFFTEQFSSDDLDVAGRTLTLTPSGAGNGYAACQELTSAFPADSAGATVLALGDDDSALVSLTGGAQVLLYGTGYDSFHVGSNGYLTFGVSDTAYSESLSAHFSLPRISGLFDDLNPSAGGQISWQQESDRVVVTYADVPEFSRANSNSFQIELFFDGMVRITHLSMSAVDGIVGLAAGAGVPTGFVESDLTGYVACAPETVCGDGVVTGGETCDDGGTALGDGCDASCQVEPGWVCSGAPSVCGATCGDGLVTGGGGV